MLLGETRPDLFSDIHSFMLSNTPVEFDYHKLRCKGFFEQIFGTLLSVFLIQGNMLKVNKYSAQTGATPLLHAIMMGWDFQSAIIEPSFSQFDGCIKPSYLKINQHIILALLSRDDININLPHLKNGMTALHIACARKDNPSLILALLKKGADPMLKDDEGRTPGDLLDCEIEMNTLSDALLMNPYEPASPETEISLDERALLKTMLIPSRKCGFSLENLLKPDTSFQAIHRLSQHLNDFERDVHDFADKQSLVDAFYAKYDTKNTPTSFLQNRFSFLNAFLSVSISTQTDTEYSPTSPLT